MRPNSGFPRAFPPAEKRVLRPKKGVFRTFSFPTPRRYYAQMPRSPFRSTEAMQVTTMSFTVEPCNQETVIVRIGKALDFRNAAEFKSTCQTQVRSGARNFILDFSETGILDSTGLGSIFSLYRQVSPLEGQVVFAAVSRPVQVVVQLTRTYKVFRQFPSVEAAEEALL